MLHVRDATLPNASVEWVFAKQVKLAGREFLIQEVTISVLLPRPQRRSHGSAEHQFPT